MSFWLTLSRTPTTESNPDGDLHPTDIEALAPLVKVCSGGCIGTNYLQVLTKGDAISLCEILGPTWENEINKFAPPEKFTEWAARLRALRYYLRFEHQSYWMTIQNLFKIMGERGVGGELSW